MAYDKTNRGAIWGNKKKEKDTHPDFTGSLDVDGTAYWVNAWRRKEDAGPDAPAMTFTVRPKEDKPAQTAPAKPAARSRGDEEDFIPF